ncbi:unnamed protein product [Caenorhabditis sp. 36 PRJEB53466]|nr:unnamed protein product [Caenorhabditis sp. 36 PRJEB53466]
MSRRQLDYQIYMAQFKAEEKEVKETKDSDRKHPQVTMSIYPHWFPRPETQTADIRVKSSIPKEEIIQEYLESTRKTAGKV